MTINVSEALDSDTAIIITVERTTGGYVNRKFVKNPPVTFKALASPQPASADDLQILSEGDREKSIIKFICNKAVYTTRDRDGLPSDVIIWKGQRYRVINAADWNQFGHSTVLGAKEENAA